MKVDITVALGETRIAHKVIDIPLGPDWRTKATMDGAEVAVDNDTTVFLTIPLMLTLGESR